ncbi:hypothetical protein JKP88DRAFT_298828 [Tribonema minus]|uniref:DUF4440 domain-containing protein n=1 Tax=Tribonema minus TaxID=303371 RepID=A0A835ZK57_9STRA|nr:hypothetical protein JKP88DRAFT_298828 [Tribonema minus]
MISLGTPDDEALSDKEAIELLLGDQVAAWNRGDLNGFLAGYTRSKDLTFTCDGVTRRGFDATQKRFLQAFAPKQGVELSPGDLGILELTTPLNIVLLGKDAAWEGWRIIHDHTSYHPAMAQGTP